MVYTDLSPSLYALAPVAAPLTPWPGNVPLYLVGASLLHPVIRSRSPVIPPHFQYISQSMCKHVQVNVIQNDHIQRTSSLCYSNRRCYIQTLFVIRTCGLQNYSCCVMTLSLVVCLSVCLSACLCVFDGYWQLINATPTPLLQANN